MNEKSPIMDTDVLGNGAMLAMVVGTLFIFQWSNRAVYEVGAGMFALGFVAYLASLLLSRVNWHVFAERTIVALMMTGILGMFQSWNIQYYEYGFYIVGIATLSFIIISHIPAPDDA